MINDKEKALVEREGPSQNIVKYRPMDTKLTNNWLGCLTFCPASYLHPQADT